MCLIIDANFVTLVFAAEPAQDYLPIRNALSEGRARAMIGGHLQTEYFRVKKLIPIWVELNRKGVLKSANEKAVVAETAKFAAMTLKSDDPHILALAKVSGARLLCSHDQPLHSDFTNSALLTPKGNIYQNASHQSLIARHCSQPDKRKRKRS